MRHGIAALALFLACACSHEAPSSADIEPVDEPAGWSFAQIRPPVQPLAVDTVATITDATLLDRSETLFRVSSGLVDERRTSLFVVNGGWHQVLRYDWKSGELDSFGRRGQGPGDFLRPLWLARLGADSLVVYDRDQARFSVHSTPGEHRRTFQTPGIGLRGRQPAMLVGTSDRRFVLAVSSGLPAVLMEPESAPGARARDTLSVIVIDDAGRLTDSIVRLDNRMWRRLPDPASVNIAAVEDAWHALVASDGQWVLTGNTHSTSIATLSLSGDTVGTLELAPVAVAGQRSRSLDQLLLGADGALWVGEAAQEEEPTRLLRIDRSGAVGSISVPAGTRMLDARGDLLLVRQRSSLDAESVWLLSAKFPA